MKAWLARDKNGRLFLYSSRGGYVKPFQSQSAWHGEEICELEKSKYPEVAWENSPVACDIEIKITLPFTGDKK